jgi:ribulose-bisphosphate carboxylase small chain
MSALRISTVPAVAVRPAAAKASAMRVWQPVNNKFFETFSYLPPLDDAAVAKQVDYITRNGWVPCLEFAEPELAYVSDTNANRIKITNCYQDNRYWTMYKLPMFGCTDSSQVLKEIDNATKSFPKAYIRLVAFDPNRQVQVAGMLVHRPAGANDLQPMAGRSV